MTISKKSMSFLQHVEELRRVLLRSVVAVLLGTILCLYFSPQLYSWLKKPLEELLSPGNFFVATGPFETYLIYFKVALVFGILLVSPLLFYFLWSFIRPGLKSHEARPLLPMAILSGLLFSGGALFGYFLVFPPSFALGLQIIPEGTKLLPPMSDYLSLSLKLLFGFGLVFELPLFLWILGKLGLVTAQQLRRLRKYAIVLAFLVAAFLTGPDVPSQVLMALPLVFFYELGRFLVWLGQKKGSSNDA